LRRLRRPDKALLGILLPIWLLCFALHVREVVRSGLAVPPVFVAPSGGEDYPIVGGLRPETYIPDPGLRAGDRVLRAGEVDLRGAGYIHFFAVVLEQAGSELSVPVVFEREDKRGQITLPMSQPPVPWYRIPPLLALAVAAVLVLLRAPQVAQGRRFFAAFMFFVILQTPFSGAVRLQTYAYEFLFLCIGGLTVSLTLRWAILFPDEVKQPRSLAPEWAWLAAPLWYGLRLNFLFGGPLPPPLLPGAAFAMDVLFLVGFLGALTWNYRCAEPIGRRRIKWILAGFYLATLVSAVEVFATLMEPGSPWLGELLAMSMLAWPLVPIGALIGIVRYNLFDIDRLISASAAYGVILFALLAGTLIGLPRLALALSGTWGIDPSSAHIFLALAVAAAVVPAQRYVRPWVDRLLFKERVALEQGAAELMRALSSCTDRPRLFARAGDTLDTLLQPEWLVIYRSQTREFDPVFVTGRSTPVRLTAGSPLVAALAEQTGPLARERGSGTNRLTPFDRAALDTLGAEAIVPIRCMGRLAAFLCLGARRSGDIYTSTDQSVLASVGDRIGTELARLREVKTIGDETEVDPRRLSYDLGRAFAARADLNDLFRFAMAQCREVLRAEGAAVLLLDSDQGQLYFPYVADSDAAVAERLSRVRFPVNQGIAGAAVRGRVSVRVDDVSTDPRFFPGVDEQTGRTTRSLIAVPLVVRINVIGVVEVVNRHDGEPFDDRDLALLEAVAESLAEAIETTRQRASRDWSQKVKEGLIPQASSAARVEEPFGPPPRWAAVAGLAAADAGMLQHTDRTSGVLAPGPAECIVENATLLAEGEGSRSEERRSETSVFRKEGDFWTICYHGATVRLKDAKGLEYLAHLLRRPGRELHVTELIALGELRDDCVRDRLRSAALDAPSISISRDLGDAGPVLDAQATAEYKRRLEDLHADLEEAERFNDPGRATKAREEMELIADQLAAAAGLGGRERKASAHAERARLLVTQRIKATIKKVRQANPALGQHLALSVKTGYFCAYNPSPQSCIDWHL
jgi:GAF domain-containing protein